MSGELDKHLAQIQGLGPAFNIIAMARQSLATAAPVLATLRHRPIDFVDEGNNGTIDDLQVSHNSICYVGITTVIGNGRWGTGRGGLGGGHLVIQ
jgi:hypothetical protein